MRRSDKWLWRWRSNPLRRPADVTEAWVGLAAAALAVAVPAVGASTGFALEAALRDTAQEQQSTRQLTEAVLLEDAKTSIRDLRAGQAADRVPVRVSWKAPDGSARTGGIKVGAGRRAGTTTRIWTDSQGRITARPLTSAQATANAVAGGALAGGTALMLVEGVRRLVVRRLDRQRMEQWDVVLAELGIQPNQNR